MVISGNYLVKVGRRAISGCYLVKVGGKAIKGRLSYEGFWEGHQWSFSCKGLVGWPSVVFLLWRVGGMAISGHYLLKVGGRAISGRYLVKVGGIPSMVVFLWRDCGMAISSRFLVKGWWDGHQYSLSCEGLVRWPSLVIFVWRVGGWDFSI